MRKFRFGLVLAIICGICISDCVGKPTDAESSVHDKFPEEDSDMLMEPDEFAAHVSVVRSQSQQIYPTSTELADEEQSPSLDSHSEAAQNVYPPFYREQNSPPLGHSRPYFNAEGAPAQKFNGGNTRTFDPTILGSGDFGVIRGGTFYPEDEMPYQHETEENTEYNQFYGVGQNNNNGHGRPQADAFIQKFTYPEEQFANFRDFADINTPSDYASSHFVVVYANRNTTALASPLHHSNPKNIFEQLQLLDKEKAVHEKKNRLSKSKLKLAQTKLAKKYKKKLGPKDIDYEPLLALS